MRACRREELVVGVVRERLNAAVVLRVLLANARHLDRAGCLEVQVTRKLLDV